MSFDATNKKLIGTPTSAGTSDVTITATDSNSCVGTAVIAFTRVCPTITVSPTTLADGVAGVAYTQAFRVQCVRSVGHLQLLGDRSSSGHEF